jgi:hypothetical protein
MSKPFHSKQKHFTSFNAVLQAFGLSPRKFVLPSSWWEFLVESQVDLGGDLERFRVERYPILCGLLTRDIDIFVALNFGCKSCVCVLDLLYISIVIVVLIVLSVLALEYLVIIYSC